MCNINDKWFMNSANILPEMQGSGRCLQLPAQEDICSQLKPGLFLNPSNFAVNI